MFFKTLHSYLILINLLKYVCHRKKYSIKIFSKHQLRMSFNAYCCKIDILFTFDTIFQKLPIKFHAQMIPIIVLMMRNISGMKYGYDECLLVWWQFYNFIVRHMKFNIFLHPNEHPQRIFWYIIRLFDWEPSKIGHSFTK